MLFFRKITLFISVTLLIGCVSPKTVSTTEANYQEDILLRVKNYSGLINLYRTWLKKKDDPETRLKLARYYYLAGDYKTSLYTLQPLINKPSQPLYQLQAQNMIALGDFAQAIRVTDKMMLRDKNNAEAWNLRGVAQALSGKLSEGKQSVEQARALFIADDVALNNLAMVAILDRRYQDAVGLLLPQYLRGRKDERILRNLVLSLVKVGDFRYARDVIRDENLSQHPDELISALKQITTTGRSLG